MSQARCNYCKSGKNCSTLTGPIMPVILGGIDNSGANLTTVEIIENVGHSCNYTFPDIPTKLAFKDRAGYTIGPVIYACGGVNMCNKYTTNCMYLDMTKLWDFNWHDDISPMTTARTEASAVGAYGELYIIGGLGVNTTKTVEVFNTQYGTWRQLSPSMPNSRAGHCSVVMNDLIFVIGGDTDGTALSMDMFNITENVWKRTQVFRTIPVRSGHACVLLGNDIFVTGGLEHLTNHILRSSFSINIMTFETRTLPDMNHSRISHGLTLNHNQPYAVGGYNRSSSNNKTANVDSNEILVQGKWVTFGALKSARSQFALTSVTQDIIPCQPL